MVVILLDERFFYVLSDFLISMISPSGTSRPFTVARIWLFRKCTAVTVPVVVVPA
jgi:hypothetical protein